MQFEPLSFCVNSKGICHGINDFNNINNQYQFPKRYALGINSERKYHNELIHNYDKSSINTIETIRKYLEKATNPQALIFSLLAGESTTSLLNNEFFEELNNFNKKLDIISCLFYNFEQINTGISPIYELFSTVTFQKYSDLILPFDIYLIAQNNLENFQNPMKLNKSFQNINELLAECFFKFFLPIKLMGSNSIDINEMIKKLIRIKELKFITSNLYYPVSNLSPDLFCDSFVKNCFLSPNLQGTIIGNKHTLISSIVNIDVSISEEYNRNLKKRLIDTSILLNSKDFSKNISIFVNNNKIDSSIIPVFYSCNSTSISAFLSKINSRVTISQLNQYKLLYPLEKTTHLENNIVNSKLVVEKIKTFYESFDKHNQYF